MARLRLGGISVSSGHNSAIARELRIKNLMDSGLTFEQAEAKVKAEQKRGCLVVLAIWAVIIIAGIASLFIFAALNKASKSNKSNQNSITASPSPVSGQNNKKKSTKR